MNELLEDWKNFHSEIGFSTSNETENAEIIGAAILAAALCIAKALQGVKAEIAERGRNA